MKASDFNTSQYLNAKTAGELNGTTITIYEVTAELVGQGEKQRKKPVIGFEGIERKMVLNRVNREVLAQAFGDEMNDWRGKKVVLGLVNTMFEGKMVLGIALTPVTQASIT